MVIRGEGGGRGETGIGERGGGKCECGMESGRGVDPIGMERLRVRGEDTGESDISVEDAMMMATKETCGESASRMKRGRGEGGGGVLAAKGSSRFFTQSRPRSTLACTLHFAKSSLDASFLVFESIKPC